MPLQKQETKIINTLKIKYFIIAVHISMSKLKQKFSSAFRDVACECTRVVCAGGLRALLLGGAHRSRLRQSFLCYEVCEKFSRQPRAEL